MVLYTSGVTSEVHHIHMSLIVFIPRSVHPTGCEVIATNLVSCQSDVTSELHHIHMSLAVSILRSVHPLDVR